VETRSLPACFPHKGRYGCAGAAGSVGLVKTSEWPALAVLRSNGFLLGLFLAVLVAFLLPGPGARDGVLHAETINTFGIALIMFLQGLTLAVEKVKAGLTNWRLHLIIQAFTFMIFPLVGLGLQLITPHLWSSEPRGIRDGFLYLCVLPSTVSTSVVFTSIAHGNTPGALFNAALSNILGVMLTPILVHLLMQTTGHSAPFGPLLLQISLLTLLPFALGMLTRPGLRRWIDGHKKWATRLSNGVILFIVYSAFCDSIERGVWSRYRLSLTAEVLLVVMLLFGVISLLTYGTCRAFRLDRGDTIAAYFCSVKKTLAMGVPLALIIFGARNDISLILLPIMFYHPFQLLVNGLLANRWSKSAPLELQRAN
jgi:sodium/bile acid cotransporter 7